MSKDLVWFNGALVPPGNISKPATNRALLYGDSVFESMRFHAGDVYFVDDHFQRLIGGMYSIGLDTTLLNPMEIYDGIRQLCSELSYENARVRMTVFRREGGYYKPDSDRFHVLLTAEELPDDAYRHNQKGLRLGLFSDIRKPVNALAGVKSGNALLYVLAARHARDHQWDDALLLNEHGRICEASSSNLFLVMPDKRIVTPPLSEGILPGVFRRNLIAWMQQNHIQIEEQVVLSEDMFKAEEVFLTNVTGGIRWVIAFREKRYFAGYSKEILEAFKSSDIFFSV
ncbi:MAG: aminotransferase class IV [Bacteroidia bacterium]